jgi:hypothetical protein
MLQFLYILTNIVSHFCFYYSRSSRYEVVRHRGFDLPFPKQINDVKHLSMCILAICKSVFGEIICSDPLPIY